MWVLKRRDRSPAFLFSWYNIDMSHRKKLVYRFMPRVAITTAKGIQWYEVTWYSKLAAAIFIFGIFPALSFYIGEQYKVTEIAIGEYHCAPPVN